MIATILRYWLDNQSLLSCPTAGCQGGAVDVDLRAPATGLAVTPTAVYVTATAGSNGILYRITR